MPTHRCYFLNYDDHIEAAEDIDADRLDEAVQRGLSMLAARPQQHSIEVWEGALRLFASGILRVAARHECDDDSRAARASRRSL